MKEEHEKREGHHRGRRRGGEEGSHQRGAKTFRRGRAIAFLERMHLKRATIKQQLDQPEFQSIQPILIGELKAIDMVISEFIQLFEINEDEVVDPKKAPDTSGEGSEVDETN
ncbi:hypothetical protein [Sporosarcina sp. FSL K6-3457]|uniref:hypothetical protein n=1 Tax=Sporosarcina sp. FSL K6-3457 TaxID=2978204 RepID=UPI0030FA0167